MKAILITTEIINSLLNTGLKKIEHQQINF